MLAKGRVQGEAKQGGPALREWEEGTFGVVKENNLGGLSDYNAEQRK